MGNLGCAKRHLPAVACRMPLRHCHTTIFTHNRLKALAWRRNHSLAARGPKGCPNKGCEWLPQQAVPKRLRAMPLHLHLWARDCRAVFCMFVWGALCANIQTKCCYVREICAYNVERKEPKSEATVRSQQSSQRGWCSPEFCDSIDCGSCKTQGVTEGLLVVTTKTDAKAESQTAQDTTMMEPLEIR